MLAAAASANWALAIGALIGALPPAIAMWITFKQRTDSDYNTRQDQRLNTCEQERRRLEVRCQELTDENLELMRRLLEQRKEKQ